MQKVDYIVFLYVITSKYIHTKTFIIIYYDNNVKSFVNCQTETYNFTHLSTLSNYSCKNVSTGFCYSSRLELFFCRIW